MTLSTDVIVGNERHRRDACRQSLAAHHKKDWRAVDGEVETFDIELPEGWMGLDIGPRSAEKFSDIISTAGTVLWNGPMGVFEDERFAAGTRRVGRAVASAEGVSVVGGGDSCRAIDELGLADQISFMSTGGGASLELLEFGDLPGLAALRAAPNAPRS